MEKQSLTDSVQKRKRSTRKFYRKNAVPPDFFPDRSGASLSRLSAPLSAINRQRAKCNILDFPRKYNPENLHKYSSTLLCKYCPGFLQQILSPICIVLTDILTNTIVKITAIIPKLDKNHAQNMKILKYFGRKRNSMHIEGNIEMHLGLHFCKAHN